MTRFFNQIGKGMSAYARSVHFIFSNGLWYYFFFPLAFNIILFVGGNSLINLLTDLTTEWIELIIIEKFNNLPGWLLATVQWITWLILKVSFFFIFILFGGYISIIILSPVLAFLSEKTDSIITGNKYPFNAQQFMRDVIRAIIIAIRNILIQSLWFIVFFIISFIPIIGSIISIIGNFLICSYFYGFSFMDYTNERMKLSMRESIVYVSKNRGLSIGIGSIFVMCFFLPFIGSIIASFMTIVSVVAATLAIYEEKQ